jgi:hypothetical protein
VLGEVEEDRMKETYFVPSRLRIGDCDLLERVVDLARLARYLLDGNCGRHCVCKVWSLLRRLWMRLGRKTRI